MSPPLPHPYLLPEVQLADEQVDQVEVAAVEEQVDEAQHGRGAHHVARQVGEPHHRLDDAHRDQVQTRGGSDHRVPLRKPKQGLKNGAFFQLTWQRRQVFIFRTAGNNSTNGQVIR